MKKFKTTNDAFDYMLGVVSGLKTQFDIEVIIKSFVKKDMINKYNGSERASSEKWCTICFKPTTNEQCESIYMASKSLRWLGISFDSGGGMGSRDWQTDWSFSYNPDKPNSGTREESIDDLHQLLNDLDPIEK